MTPMMKVNGSWTMTTRPMPTTSSTGMKSTGMPRRKSRQLAALETLRRPPTRPASMLPRSTMVEKDKAMMAALSADPNGIEPRTVRCQTTTRVLARDPILAKVLEKEKGSPVLEKARASFGDGDHSEKARAKEKATLAEASLEVERVLENATSSHSPHQCDLA